MKNRQEEEHGHDDDNGVVYVVAIDTRGLPASDLQEGFEELTCSREYFVNHILHNVKTRCVTCPLAERCGLSKHLKIYFQEYLPGEGSRSSDPDEDLAWSEYFPIGHNNPGGTLLTMDQQSGYAQYNIQGIAHAVYDDGRYPLSKEQVWGLCEMAYEAKDIFFCNETNRQGQVLLSRWSTQYKNQHWGPSSIYQPRNLDQRRMRKKCTPFWNRKIIGTANFEQTCLI